MLSLYSFAREKNQAASFPLIFIMISILFHFFRLMFVLLIDGSAGSKLYNRWEIIYNISLGIARGLDHLHYGLQKPLIHGNLKSRNVMLDSSLQPQLSDFGLHLLLRPVAAQAMLEALTIEGYKSPELIEIKDASRETDIYSLGIILLRASHSQGSDKLQIVGAQPENVGCVHH
ncbi:putative kinase-like protein TMKL1 [Platanthera guangdongensis]|uniref:Kinase-like protein TMKL1 n=1 Tax=Platanthera guangdongensis TaxID=2320717 RepID=A0ABR2MHI9_9ASPA